MPGTVAKSITIKAPEDVVRARQVGREMAQDLDFGTADQTRLATAISEIARNALNYAGSGVCEIAEQESHGISSIQVTILDHGPGIPDLEMAMRDNFTTGGSLGMGLPGSKRLVDQFHIESRPGLTTVTLAMIRKRR